MGSATTVATRATKQQSVGVAVKHSTPTNDSLSSRLPKDHRSHKKKTNKKLVLIYVKCFELSVDCFGKIATVCLKFQ